MPAATRSGCPGLLRGVGLGGGREEPLSPALLPTGPGPLWDLLPRPKFLIRTPWGPGPPKGRTWAGGPPGLCPHPLGALLPAFQAELMGDVSGGVPRSSFGSSKSGEAQGATVELLLWGTFWVAAGQDGQHRPEGILGPVFRLHCSLGLRSEGPEATRHL